MNHHEVKARIRSQLDDYVATDGVITKTDITLQSIVDDLMVIVESGFADVANSLPICRCSSWARSGTIEELKANNHHPKCDQFKEN